MQCIELIRFLGIVVGLVSLGFLPILQVIAYFNESTIKTTTEPWQCNNSCEISLRNSSAISTFENFSLDSSSALFVHFRAYNLSLQPSNVILDPLNLVWVESIDAPFLSLDLGFNVYSLGLLSRKVHHMTVVLEEDARRCLWSLTYTCATGTLSTAFIRHVTKGRGVLCNTINHTKSLISAYPVTYQCCRENRNSRQIQCGVPALISFGMTAIFETVAVVTAIAFFYFPVLWVNFPDEDSSKVLGCNTQIRINPAYQIVRHIMKAVRRHCASYWAEFVKTIIIGVFTPIFYYGLYIQTWYISEYEIPKMFNDDVKKTWDFRMDLKYFVKKVIILTVLYIISITCLALHDCIISFFAKRLTFDSYLTRLAALKKEVNGFKINWKIPIHKTRDFVRNICCEISFFEKLIFPFCLFFCLCGYALYITATVRSIDFLVRRTIMDRRWCVDNMVYGPTNRRRYVLYQIIPFYFVVLYVGVVLYCSLVVISRLIVYVCVGLVATKDEFLPMLIIIFVFGYYIFDCFNYESGKYQNLLKQTFEKCNESKKPGQQDQALQFDEEGAPIISTKLFQHVMDKILPLSEVYTKLFLKITIILSFLLVTYFTIMTFGKSSLNDYTKALAIFFGAIIPKLVDSFPDNSSELIDIQNSCKIEKIVNDFKNSNENSGNRIPRDYLPELSSNDSQNDYLPELSSSDSQNDDCAIEMKCFVR